MFLVVANFPVFFLENFMEQQLANTTFYVIMIYIYSVSEGLGGRDVFRIRVCLANALRTTYL